MGTVLETASAKSESLAAKVGKRGFPSLRQHKTGVYFWREKGKDRYCGSDPAAAQRAWLGYFGERLSGSSPTVQAVSPQTDSETAPAVQSSPKVAKPRGEGPRASEVPQGRTVNALAERLWGIIDGQCTPERARVYRYELAPFLKKFGSRPLSSLSPDDLLWYRAQVVKSFKPWTANGRLAVLRRALTLADTLEWVERPFRLKLLGGVAIGETKAKAWTPEEVSAKLAKVAETNVNLARMLRLQFLCCLRPFSLPELVAGRGHWEAEGVFVLDRSKTEKKTGEKQRVCLSPEALAELKRIEPMYDNGRLYRQAVKLAGGFAPHALRHSGATALAHANVSDELIETALGHIEPRVKRTYRPQKYQRAREALSILAKLVPEVGAKSKGQKERKAA